jgi:hypothetical protein
MRENIVPLLARDTERIVGQIIASAQGLDANGRIQPSPPLSVFEALCSARGETVGFVSEHQWRPLVGLRSVASLEARQRDRVRSRRCTTRQPTVTVRSIQKLPFAQPHDRRARREECVKACAVAGATERDQ